MMQRIRRKAVPEQSVSGLMGCLDVFFLKKNSRNLDKLLTPMKQAKWGGTPSLIPLVEIKDFFESAHLRTWAHMA